MHLEVDHGLIPVEIDEGKIYEIIEGFVDHTAYGPGKLIGIDVAANSIINLLKGE